LLDGYWTYYHRLKMKTKSERVRFVLADEFLSHLLAYRIVWIDGYHGGGKTTLGHVLGCWLMANGYVDRVVSNMPSGIRSEVTVPLNRAAIIMDEAWIYLDDRDAVTDYAAFIRKFEHYLIMPSVWDVHMRLSFFRTWRTMNLYAFGLPVWIYKWEMHRNRTKDKGWYLLLNPHNIFGLFPTEFVPGDDGGIYNAIKETAKAAGYKGKRSRGYEFQAPGGVVEAGFAKIQDGMEDAVRQVSEKAEELDEAIHRARRIRRR
jgi:hypothetical protein